MLLRVYFTSSPRVLEKRRISLTVCLTNEVSEPLPWSCALHIEVLDGDAEASLGPLEDQRLTDEGALPNGAWHTRIEGVVPQEYMGREVGARVHLCVAALPAVRAEDHCVDAWFGCLPCVSAPLELASAEVLASARADDHCFRTFLFRGRRLRIREEMTCHEMTTGGRLWDAGVALADCLASCYASSLAGKSFVELGCGCGLPGITAATMLSGRVVLTDHREVLPLTKINVQANVVGGDGSGRAAVTDLEWADQERCPAVLRDFNEGHPFDVVLLADTLYAPTMIEPLCKTVLELSAPGTLVLAAQKFRGERCDGPLGTCNHSGTSVQEQGKLAAVAGTGVAKGSDGTLRGMRGFAVPLCDMLRSWFEIRLVQSDQESPMRVVTLEMLRVR